MTPPKPAPADKPIQAFWMCAKCGYSIGNHRNICPKCVEWRAS